MFKRFDDLGRGSVAFLWMRATSKVGKYFVYTLYETSHMDYFAVVDDFGTLVRVPT